MAIEKIEPRGKYSGCKAHLTGKECQAVLDWNIERKHGNSDLIEAEAVKFVKDLAKSIKALMKEHPNLLKDRTEEEIAAALEKDKQKILQQQGAMKNGKDWKKVK